MKVYVEHCLKVTCVDVYVEHCIKVMCAEIDVEHCLKGEYVKVYVFTSNNLMLFGSGPLCISPTGKRASR